MNCLIAEDDAALAELWTIGLERAGHQVTAVNSVDAAAHALRFGNFDVILLDLYLGEENSLALTAMIGYVAPAAKVIVVTGSRAFPYGEVFGHSPNIAGMLHKPVPLSDLVAYVEHLGRRDQDAFDTAPQFPTGVGRA